MRKLYFVFALFAFTIVMIQSCNNDDDIVQDQNQGEEGPDPDPEETNGIEFKEEDISFNLVNLKWGEVAGPNNEKVVYDIYLGDTKIKDSNTDTDYTLTQLKANTKYTGRIVPKTIDNEADPKTIRTNTKASIELDPIPFSVTTKQFADPNAPVPEISNATVDNLQKNSAILNWDTATISDNSEITYNVYLEGDLLASNLTDNTYSFENLEPNTFYKGILLAISTNQKSAALDFQFTTLPDPNEVPLTSFTFYRGDVISIPAIRRIQLITISSPVDANTTDLNWISSDESIASVDEFGYVFTKDAGTTIVTATSVDNQDIKASISITVTDRSPDNQRYINIARPRSSVLIGGTKKIQVTDTNSRPGDTRDFLFTSSDPNIATIDSEGNIKGVAIGTVAITATSASNPEVTDSAMLRVLKEPIPITDLIFNFDNPRTLYVEEQQYLFPRILPIDATNRELIFTSTNTNVIEISNTLDAKGVNPGNASVIVTSVADNSISATRDFNVITDPISLDQDTGLYTAPANSEVTISFFSYLSVDPQSDVEFATMSVSYSVKDSSGVELLDQSNQPEILDGEVYEIYDGTKSANLNSLPMNFTMPADGKVTIEIAEIRLFNSQEVYLDQAEFDINNTQGPRKIFNIPLDTVIQD